MGNLCSHDIEKFTYLENKIEEQNASIEKLYEQNRLLKRQNRYFKNRIDKWQIQYNNDTKGI